MQKSANITLKRRLQEYAEGSKECIHPEKSKHAEDKIPVGPEKNNKREENPKISSGSVAYDKKEDIKSNPIILDRKDAGLTIEDHSDKNNINTSDKKDVTAQLLKDLNDSMPVQLSEVSKNKIIVHLPVVSKEEIPAQLPENTKKELLIPCIDVPEETSKLLPDSLQKEKADKQPDQVLKFNFDINDRFIDHEADRTEEKQEEKQNSPKILNTDANTSFIQGKGTKDNEL
ncbi:hypothetical protein NEIG_02515 [Nematocida sp. ERTm5]|nr:hypothetical protein NEIG_02515 [Nematocida sp. ERTm5]